MPRIASLIVRKPDGGTQDAIVQPTEYVKKKFALFLKKLRAVEFNRDQALKETGILPGQLHRWLKKYPELRANLEICEEGLKDYAEKRLVDFMKMNNKIGMVSTIYYLKTKFRDRGYSEQFHFNATVENKYPQEMIDAVANAAIYGGRSIINVTPDTKRLTSGEED